MFQNLNHCWILQDIVQYSKVPFKLSSSILIKKGVFVKPTIKIKVFGELLDQSRTQVEN